MSGWAASLTVGASLPPLKKLMTPEAMTNPLMAGTNPIHFDPEFARRHGLPAPIATGMISEGYLSQMLTEAFGAAWLQGGRISVAFVKPVYAGDEVSCHAVVSERVEDGAGVTLTFELWCENQRGEKVTAGTASVKILGAG